MSSEVTGGDPIQADQLHNPASLDQTDGASTSSDTLGVVDATILTTGSDSENPALSPIPTEGSETTKSGETISQETKLREVDMLAKHLFKQVQKTAEKAKPPLSEGQQKVQEIAAATKTRATYPQTHEDGSAHAQAGLYKDGPTTLSGNDAFTVSFDEQSIVGGTATLSGKCVEIRGAVGDNFICHIELSDGSGFRTITIPQSDVQTELVVANKDVLLTNFSSDQKKLMELYIDTLQKGPDALPDNANEVIRHAAREAGIPTTDDVIAFTENIGGLSDDEKKAIVDLANGNILSFEAFDKALRTSELSPDNLKKQLGSLQDQLDEWLKVPNDKRSKEVTQKITDLTNQIHVLSEFQKIYNGPLEDFFTQLQSGDIPPEAAKEFINTFRGGQITEETFQKFEEQFPGLKRLPGETHEEWKQRMIKSAGVIGFGALILLLIGSQFMKTATESAPAGGH